jgi:cytochrome c5
MLALGLSLPSMMVLSVATTCMSAYGQPANQAMGARQGLEHITTKAYSPTIMDPIIFANLWRSWDTASRDAAEKAFEEVRRKMTLKRYGLLEAPFENGGAPLGMVVKKDGTYAMTCLICHAGQVAGQTILGLPNNALNFSAIYEDVEKTVTLLHGDAPGNPPFPEGLLFMTHGKSTDHVDFPEGLLSLSRGTMNSFTFSVSFFSFRDVELNVLDTPIDLEPLNHYLDPPPLWNVAKKTRFYTDGFTAKSVRALMQFSLDPSFSPDVFKAWESDYKDIYAWLHTIESPKYNGVIDNNIAAKGKNIYSQSCAGCHGTPGRGGQYTNKIVSIRRVNTDRARLDGVSQKFKKHYSNSWLGQYGEADVITRARGYVAPPLDGIWATAPYFHNGSVPTLYHVLFPDERPAVWKVKDYSAYDHSRVGLLVEELIRMPEPLTDKRAYYDTNRKTMSNKGHPFADRLSREQKMSLLEYLKSL